MLQERYIMHRTLIRWEGAKAFILYKFQCTAPFDFTCPREWKSSPKDLSAAGFFYVGNYLITSVTDDRGASVPLYVIYFTVL